MSSRRGTKLVELDKRVDLALKCLNLLIFEEAEEISAKEKKLLENRLKEYTSGKKNQSSWS